MTPIETLKQLSCGDTTSLTLWVRQLLTYDQADPNLGAQDQPAHQRLLELCRLPAPDLTYQLRRTQLDVYHAAWRLCENFDVRADGAYLGFQVLHFARRTRAANALGRFNELLAARAFDDADPEQVALWREAHWAVVSIPHSWRLIEGWVIRDSQGFDRWRGAIPLAVQISAIGVWARYGPASTFHTLLEAMQLAAFRVRPTLDASQLTFLTTYLGDLYRRTLTEAHSPSFHELHAEILSHMHPRVNAAQAEPDRRSWHIVTERLSQLLTEPVPVARIGQAKQLMADLRLGRSSGSRGA